MEDVSKEGRGEGLVEGAGEERRGVRGGQGGW